MSTELWRAKLLLSRPESLPHRWLTHYLVTEFRIDIPALSPIFGR